ncbi:hypothetical protein N0V93_002213 [Gnomoniopsis smithogilvyi]|uniref:Carboxy-cis,cis-muconate cyclase n=1 Tax=Gnomoniopsis smithogilvyi TaxID=1191159 RepID=A0A9W8YW21_9PEZI|nr:hypothetical protein N0V93_002213 [Gnomoniopsis smithogilvyi]
MVASPMTVVVGLLAPTIQAATHQMIIGTFTTSFLYTVEFDDSANTLTLLKNTTANTASQWLSLSHDKKHLYGNTASGSMEVVSYTIADTTGTDIVYNTTTPAGSCDATAVHVEALPVAPYTVYAVTYGDVCGGVDAIDATGVAVESLQNYTYPGTSAGTSSLHGLAFHPAGGYLYTADMGGRAVWSHAIDVSTGEVTLVANASYSGEPRHVTTHPSGKYAYAMTEDTSEVLQLPIDNSTGAATFAGDAWSILPSNTSGTHRGETVRVSASGTVLYASTRINASDSASVGGYVSAFTLDSEGAVVSQDFIVETTTGGGGSTGASNYVAPSLYDDDLFAILDHSTGFVEMWKRDADGKGASVVAHLDLADGGGCCSNGVWLS